MTSRAQQLKSGDVSLGLSHEWICAYGRQGGTGALLQQTIEGAEQMKRLVAYMRAGCSLQRGIVYGAAAVDHILGLPCECSDPIPKADDGEIVVYYGGWDLKTLRNCTAGRQRMHQDQDWYEKYEWQTEPGYYRLLLPVPDSNRKNWDKQLSHLATFDAAWNPAPVCVGATALLAHLTETGEELLDDNWCRFAEPVPGDYRAELAVCGGRVVVRSGWGAYDDGLVLGSGARKC